MKLRIIHISDWHGQYGPIPEADIYVATGDMLPTFGEFLIQTWSNKRGEEMAWCGRFGPLHGVDGLFDDTRLKKGFVINRRFVADREEELQRRWIEKVLGSYRKHLGSPDAPVVCVRGNHDFHPLAPAFGGEVYEFGTKATTFTVKGLRFTGVRGVPWIAGEWSDELRDEEAEERFSGLELDDRAEVVVTHCPAKGIMDNRAMNYGCAPLATYLNRRSFNGSVPCPPKLHCFGHVHESKGVLQLGETIFSNAAESCNTIELEV